MLATRTAAGHGVEVRPARSVFEVEREARWRVWALFGLLAVAIWVGLMPLSLVVELVWRDLTAGSVSVSLETLQGVVAMSGILALVLAASAWIVSQHRGGDRLRAALNAVELDPRDPYHLRFRHVVDELRLAAGLPELACVVVPVPGIDAFSFADPQGLDCVGVTDGALGRLSREEFQGVVAHEIAHIASRDCVTATRVCLLFAGIGRARRTLVKTAEFEFDAVDQSGAFALPLVVLFLISVVPEFVAWLLLTLVLCGGWVVNLAVSRQREYAADATAARLTRDPLSLADALLEIQDAAKTTTTVPPELSSLAIRPPDPGRRGVSTWFSSHPPLSARIERLRALAHTRSSDPSAPARELAVRRLAREHLATPPGAAGLVVGGAPTSAAAASHDCPACGAVLRPVAYEGTTIRACPACGGRALDHDQVETILARREMGFTATEKRQASGIAAELRRRAAGYAGRKAPAAVAAATTGLPDTGARQWPLTCPRCHAPMSRGPWSLLYPVPVDRCTACGLHWFDHDELEVLQILVESGSRARA